MFSARPVTVSVVSPTPFGWPGWFVYKEHHHYHLQLLVFHRHAECFLPGTGTGIQSRHSRAPGATPNRFSRGPQKTLAFFANVGLLGEESLVVIACELCHNLLESIGRVPYPCSCARVTKSGLRAILQQGPPVSRSPLSVVLFLRVCEDNFAFASHLWQFKAERGNFVVRNVVRKGAILRYRMWYGRRYGIWYGMGQF